MKSRVFELCRQTKTPIWYWLGGIAAGLIAAYSSSADARSIYVFGDSSAEQGNLYALPGNSRNGTPYYAPDGFSRESNGPIWTEYLFPEIRPILDHKHDAGSINFAFSGATSGSDNIAVPEAGGLTQQLQLFDAGVNNGSIKPTDESVFVIAAGVNDFFRDLGAGRDLDATAEEVASNLGNAAEHLSSAGAKTVLVENMPNFWYAPAFRGLPADQDKLILEGVETVTDATNGQITERLRALSAEKPDTNFVVVPVHALFEHIRANAAALGFTNIDEACYDPSSGTLCSTGPQVQNGYLFFDDLHLTTRAQELQARLYGAIIDTLEGGPNIAAGREADDMSEASEQFEKFARLDRRASWSGDGPREAGVRLLLDVSRNWADGTASDARADFHSKQDAVRGGIGFSNGRDWSASLSAGQVTRDTEADAKSLRYKLKGKGVFAATSRRFGPVVVGMSASKMWFDLEDGKRETGVPLLTSSFETKGTLFSAAAEAGYRLSSNGWIAVPSVGVAYRRLRIDPYAEQDADGLTLSFSKVRDNSVRATGGLYLTHEPWNVGGFEVQPALSFNAERRLDSGHRRITSELIDNSASPITSDVSASDKWVAAIEPSVSLRTQNVSFRLGYTRQERSGSSSDQVQGGVTVAF